MADQIIPLNFLPGIQRDGTRVEAQRYLDGLWCRWRNGRPRKILGYKEVVNNLQGIPRRIHQYYDGANTYIHVGTSQGIEQVVLDRNGTLVSHTDRTPSGFPGGPNVGWTMDAIFDTVGSAVQLVCHATADQQDLSNPDKEPIWIGSITQPTQLGGLVQPTVPQMLLGSYTTPNVAGGVVCSQPYVFAFCTNGHIYWSSPNQPNMLGVTGGSSGAGAARISAQKIVQGYALKGGGSNSPAALFWTMSEVITATFVGFSSGTWAFNTVSPSSSILSSDAVIEYDGIYYWAGFDRFLAYNGTVIEVENSQNADWFFDNINRQYAARSFAFKVPRYGEIWFCAPLFGAVEPSHAVIYNVREKYWYDTALPDSGRGAGYFAQGFQYPVLGGVSMGTQGYSLFLHEYGWDNVSYTGTPTPIRSYFETAFMGGPKQNPPNNNSLSFNQIEPDHIQVGAMTVHVVGGYNPLSSESAEADVVIPETATNPIDQVPGFNIAKRLGRLHFESNTLGGYYIVGASLLHGGAQSDQYFIGGVGKPLTQQP